MSNTDSSGPAWRFVSLEAESHELDWVRESLSPWWRGGFSPLRVRHLVPDSFETYLALPHGFAQPHHSALEGNLDRESLGAVLEVVAGPGSAGRARTWCAFWSGWGHLYVAIGALLARTHYSDAELAAATADFGFDIGEYVVLTGDASGLGRLLEGPHAPTPQMCWSEDRSWFLASEIDLTVSFLGLSAEMSERLLARSDLGVSVLQLDDPIPREWLD